MNYLWWFYSIILVLCLLLLVAFLTLFERNFISAVQQRNGPDFTGWWGILQPISDAIKLLLNEFVVINTSFVFTFSVSPVFSLLFGIFNWLFVPLSGKGSFLVSLYGLLWLFCLSSLHVYTIFISGISSSSKYAYLGSMRSVCQLISYEVTLGFLVMPVVLVTGSFNLSHIINHQIYVNCSNFVYMQPVALIFFICIIAETGRAPFDLPEAEAELVAGYNVEYSSLFFAFFFLGEYLNLFFMCVIMVILFFSGWGVGGLVSDNSAFYYFSEYVQPFIIFVNSVFFVSVMVWVSATFPSVSYDSLMSLCWNNFLLFSVSFFFFFFNVYLYIFIIL